MNLLKKDDNISNGVIFAVEKTVTGAYDIHRHDFFEIEYIVEGSGDYIIDGKNYGIKSNKLFFMTPASIHEVCADDTTIINIMFSGHISDALYTLIKNESSSELILSDDDSRLVLLMMREIVKNTSSGMLPYSISYLECLLIKLSQLKTSISESIMPYTKKAIIYILENFNSGITLEKTAKSVGISKNYLSELFHNDVGIGFKQYVDELRFDYMLKLLRLTDMNISEAYEKCGFTDYANFSRRFKQKFGVSPSDFRKLLE